MQQKLFEGAKPVAGFRDSAFAKNKHLPLHRWVPWIAGFSAEFVADCLDTHIPDPGKNVWVLDPFAGVGTTLVEAYTRGHNVVGFEINPYACLATRLKLKASQISTRRLTLYVAEFERFMKRRFDGNGRGRTEPHFKPPVGFSGRTELFSPKVERKVLFVLDFINSVEDSDIRDLFRIAFGSTMVSMSNYSYEPSLTRRSAVDRPKIEDAPVAQILSGKLQVMFEDIAWLQQKMRSLEHSPEIKVIPDSIFLARATLQRREFVDLVVTSPPYLNNYHYPRNTRPQLHWLGLASGRGYNGAGEGKSFGKFWQTVRDESPVNLWFQFPELAEIVGRIQRLNTNKGQYGGVGWANYVSTYFNDTYRFCQILADLLRPGHCAIIVLGNSIIQGVEIKTDYFFGKIAELSGLTFEKTVMLRKKRTGSSIIESSVRSDKPTRATALYESAIVLRKE